MAPFIVLPAPGRGAYDRSLTRVEREAEHRERLLRATAEVFREGPLTVARIVQRAGVGRSTFYEYFASPQQLLQQLEQRVLQHLEVSIERALASARTPLERASASSRAWITALEQRALEARVVLSARTGADLLSPAGRLFQQTLRRVVHVAQGEVAWFKATDDVSLLAAAAAAEALSRRHLNTSPLRDASRVLAELMIKLLR